MENVSAVTSFIMTAYTELEDHRYLYFICFLLLYIMIIAANSVLITVIYIERGLHEPMYLFICNLAVNGVYGSTSLLPSMLVLLLSHHYEVSLTNCQLQIYCLHSYAIVEFTILAVMSYDRYVAICHPLHYHVLMSPKKVYAAIELSWVIPFIYNALLFIFTVRGTFCGRIIERTHCSNFSLFKLSCFDTTIQNIVGLASVFVSPCSQIVMILFSYAQILRICLFASKESQTKAIQTCTPHLLTVINYSLGCFFDVIQGRFNMSHVPYKARIFMSLYYLIIPPLFNPVIYGISIQAIRVQIFKLFGGKK
ncbi:olfactory receptor 52D1-like [Anguilla anguilla]|uniref:olfactory receptor 52D1-like n=1 Tax=Anguilla anguilla TaxID=7936 RepID=UPI0015B060EE|nr:olfactory receptor 52D1-like [Anguilla anguilla]